MDMAGEGKNPTRAHVLKVAQAGGLNEKDAEDLIDEMLDLITDAALKVAASELPVLKKTMAVVAKDIDANRLRLAMP